MSTKQNPGPFDCYAKLAPDEPYFVLRAKDPIAPEVVELWVALRKALHGDYPKLAEARACAEAMRRWRAANPVAEPLPAQD
ncbi:MAG: aspartate decarboxylase [Gammaproteobacteria bacterium]